MGKMIGVLLITALSITTSQIVCAVDSQLKENVDWIAIQSVSFNPGEAVDSEGSASIVTMGDESYLSCAALTQMYWPGSWADVRVELRVRLGSGGFGIAIRGTESGEVEFGCARDYYVLIRPGARLREQGHSPQLDADQWYSVVFVAVGDQFSVEVDGELLFSIQDTDPLLTPGRIRIVANPTDDPICLDDIEISAKEEPKDPQALLNQGYGLLDEHENGAAYQAFAEAAELFHADGNRSGEAEALRYKGKALVSLGELTAAIDAFQQAIDVLTQINDRASVAWCYLDLGNVHMQLEDLTAAEECFVQARDSFVLLSDREGEIEALRDEARFLLKLAEGFQNVGNPTQAISSLAAAIRAFHNANDRQEEANALLWLASIYRSQMQYADMVTCCRQAEPLFQSIGDARGLRETYALYTKGYQGTGQWGLALEYGEKALAAYQAPDADLDGKAWVLQKLSQIYLARGELQLAIDHAFMAISIYREIENMAQLPELYGHLSDLHYRVGDKELGEEYSRMARDLHMSLGGTALAEGLRFAGHAYRDQGDLPAAIASVEQALSIYREAGSCGGEALCLNTLADFHQAAGRTEQAIELTQQSIELGRECGQPDIELNGWTCQARMYFYAGRYAESLPALETALEIAQDPNYQEARLGIYMQFADVYINSGRLSEGIEALEQALAIAEEREAVERQMLLHSFLAEACQDAHLLEEAKAHHEERIRIVEDTFHGLELETLQEAFFQKVRQAYVEYFMFLRSTGDLNDTLWIAERCRARTYVETVVQTDLAFPEAVPELRIRSGVVFSDEVERAAQEMIDALPEDTAVLEYFVVDQVIYLWIIGDNAVGDPIELPIHRAELMDQVIACRQALESRDPAADFYLAALYEALITPAEDLLSSSAHAGGISHLVIIPSGPLYYLPFQALLRVDEDRERQRLIERYAISYSPSLVTLRYAQQAATGDSEVLALLAIADPDSGDPSMGRLPDAQTESHRVAALFSTAEVYVDNEATETVVQDRSSTATDLLFSTHGSFDPANPMYSYLLLSPTETSDGKLHTYEVFTLPLSANLVVLSACETLLPSIAEMEDQVRATRGLASTESVELTREQLEALTAGDEVAGLTRAFLYAGTSSVLSSLWSVYSQATADLMVTFYGGIQAGKDKAEALRAAQLQIMSTPGYEHPAYWAAFNLMGDWR
jgi:CHAT domain-containing protein